MGIGKNAGRMSIAVFLSRILGLLREQVMAYVFGAGALRDVFIVAFRIPNLFRDLFAEGALSSAFVSVFAAEEDPEKRKKLARNTQSFLIFALCVLLLAMFFLAPWLVEWIAGSFRSDPEKFELTVSLTRFLSPFLLFASLAALAMGILNSLGVFFIPAMGAASFNAASILLGGGLAFYYWSVDPVKALFGFAAGTLVGGFLQWAIQWPALRRQGFLPLAGFLSAFSIPRLKEAFANPLLKKIFTLMLPAILATAAAQINVFISTVFATSLQEGSVSWLNYAFRLMHFPMGVFGVALSTATLPALSALKEDPTSFQNTLRYSSSLAVIMALGASMGLIAFREPLVAMIFEHGAFNSEDTYRTGQALVGYAIGLLAFILVKIMVAAFYALHRVWVPGLISISTIVLNYFSMDYLSSHYGHWGLSLSVSLLAFLNLSLLVVFLGREGLRILNPRFFILLFASAGLSSLLFFPAAHWGQGLAESWGFVASTGFYLVLMGFSGLVYLALISLMFPEGRDLVLRLRKRFF